MAFLCLPKDIYFNFDLFQWKGLAKVNIIKQIRRMSESEKTLWAKTLYTLHFFTLVVSLRINGL